MYCILHLYNLLLESKIYLDTKYFDVVTQVIILLVNICIDSKHILEESRCTRIK